MRHVLHAHEKSVQNTSGVAIVIPRAFNAEIDIIAETNPHDH